MNGKITYRDMSTNLLANTSVIDPILEERYTGPVVGLPEHKELAIVRNNASYPYEALVHGEYDNFMNGGPYTPHGRLDGKQCLLAADVAGSATEIQVEQYLKPDGTPIIEASGKYLLMHRLPEIGEEDEIFTNSEIAAEVITISAAYDWTSDTGTGNDDGHFPTVSAVATARKRWAVLQKIVGFTSSMNLETGHVGHRYKLEQPSVISGVIAEDGTSQTINVSFTQSLDVGIQAYLIQVLKKGDALSKYAAPALVPYYVLPSQYDDTGQVDAIFTLDSAKLVLASGTITVSGLNRYYDPATRTLAAVTGSDAEYYVIVSAMNQTVFDANLRLSPLAVSAAIAIA
jgi:hypothetical protein